MTFADAYDRVMRDLGDPDKGSAVLLAAVKEGLQEGVRRASDVPKQGWTWCRKEARIHLDAPVDSKASVANGAYELSCVSATAAHAGWRVVFDGTNQMARIRTLKQAGVAYLESAWPRPAKSTADVLLVHDRYALPADLARLAPGADELYAREIFELDGRAFHAAVRGWAGQTGATQYLMVVGRADRLGLGPLSAVGTVALTPGSVSATLGSTSASHGWIGHHLRAAGQSVLYRIESVISPGEANNVVILDREYGGTALSAGLYELDPPDECYIVQLHLAPGAEHEAIFPYVAHMPVPELSTHQMPGDARFQDILLGTGRGAGLMALGRMKEGRDESLVFEQRLNAYATQQTLRTPGTGRLRLRGGRGGAGGGIGVAWDPFA